MPPAVVAAVCVVYALISDHRMDARLATDMTSALPAPPAPSAIAALIAALRLRRSASRWAYLATCVAIQGLAVRAHT